MVIQNNCHDVLLCDVVLLTHLLLKIDVVIESFHSAGILCMSMKLRNMIEFGFQVYNN